LALHGWVYRIETGEVLSYDGILHDFVPPQNRLPDPEPIYNLHPNSKLMNYTPFKVGSERGKKATEATATAAANPSRGDRQTSSLPGFGHLPAEQANRIYRGSR
jgi:carbonic anhydrase